MFALSVPFWLLGASTERQLLPGLPMSALALFCPVTAAAILVHRQNGTAGVTRLLKRAFDYQRISTRAWYAPILLLMPGVMVLSYGLMRVMGMPLPPPRVSALSAVVLFLGLIVGAAAEEPRLVGIHHRPDAGAVDCAPGERTSRTRMGCVAHRAVGAG